MDWKGNKTHHGVFVPDAGEAHCWFELVCLNGMAIATPAKHSSTAIGERGYRGIASM